MKRPRTPEPQDDAAPEHLLAGEEDALEDVPEEELLAPEDGEPEDEDDEDDEAVQERIKDKLGEGMAERENERSISRRALALAVAALLLGIVAAVTLLVLALPEPASVPDVRPSLRTAAERAQEDLLDVHRQNLEQFTTDGVPGSEPVVTVVCGLERGDAPRRQRCELRATTYFPVTRLASPDDAPTGVCLSHTVQQDDFPPVVDRTEASCPTPAQYRWHEDPSLPQVEGHAGWVMRGTPPQGDGGGYALTTRHPLGTFEIGDCPESGCGVGQLQLPRVDYRSDGKR